MTRHQRHFDEFQPHTRLKHAILDAYIIAWAIKLLLRPGAGSRLAIVDAFAGAGHDESGRDGSPLIAARRAREAMEVVRNRKPGLQPQIHVFAIEKHQRRWLELRATMREFEQQTPGLVHVLRGELSEHIDAIVTTVGDAPTFYFLDPFGIKGLDAATYPKALAGAHNEIFALFADVGAVRLHGLLTTERADPANAVAAIRAAPTLFPEEDEAAIRAATDRAVRANETLDASIPASREHLTRALGGEQWIAAVQAAAPLDRANAFLESFQQTLSRAGASHVLTLPMRNDAGQRVYALVHASKSAAGFVTMKEAISTRLMQADLNDAALIAMREDLEIDIPGLVMRLREAFRGVDIPWAEDRNGLRDVLLANTPLFQFQKEAAKAALREAGILRRINRKEICSFPGDT